MTHVFGYNFMNSLAQEAFLLVVEAEAVGRRQYEKVVHDRTATLASVLTNLR